MVKMQSRIKVGIVVIAYIHKIYVENIKTDEDDLEFGNDSIKRINK